MRTRAAIGLGLLGVLGAGLGVAWRLGRRVVVDGGSMYPLLYPGDRLVVDRLAYRLRRPRRGDLVLVEGVGRQLPERLVKRVAGLPGERVVVARDRLWIDGRALRRDGPMVGSLPGAWELGPNEYFVLSHAVASGTDSRHVGPIPRAALHGRVWAIYGPPPRRRRLGRTPLELEDPGE